MTEASSPWRLRLISGNPLRKLVASLGLRGGWLPPVGTHSEAIHTEIVPVDIDEPHDRDGTFEPAIVRKRQRRLDGIDQVA